MFEGVPIAVHFDMVEGSGNHVLGKFRNYTKCLDGCVESTLKELKADCTDRQRAALATGT